MPNDLTIREESAPGAPGKKAKWTSGAKSGIGRSLDKISEVTFTIVEGILTEMYYPAEDIASVKEMSLVVTDDNSFFSEEKSDTFHNEKVLKEGVPAYLVSNVHSGKLFTINKEIITDPERDTVLVKINFSYSAERQYHIYVNLFPHLNNKGDNNTGWAGQYNDIPMLFAEGNGLALALACSNGWLNRTVGFNGTSDGLTDLQMNKKLTRLYSKADNGNIVLTGEADISGSDEFVLAIGFGTNPYAAGSRAWSSILSGFENAKKLYVQEWYNWLRKLHDVPGNFYKTSAAVLKINESKGFPGAIMASLSIPWGEVKGDSYMTGYHVVWPRDLVECAGSLLALGTGDDALRVLNFIISTRQKDGSWPKNIWLSGNPAWKGLEVDETALPIIFAGKCMQLDIITSDRMNRYWPVLKGAIGFLIRNGPYTEEDRWEQMKGFTPFTSAAFVTALVVAADIADANGEKGLAQYCLETADYWNESIEESLYVTGTSLAAETGVDGYYIRTNPLPDTPAQELGSEKINIDNYLYADKVIAKEFISVDALALVRFGLRAPDDQRILNTIKVIDRMLKVVTPGGPCWRRFNCDGYGENEKGEGFIKKGIGRLWPLLTGERGHYEVAAGNLREASALLGSMEAFSTNGFFPEQIWDSADLPEKGLFFGKHTHSAMPLTWAHSEYIKLCKSIKDGYVFDMPHQTRHRYIIHNVSSPFRIWRFNSQTKRLNGKRILRIEVDSEAVVRWTDDDWKTENNTETKDTGIGLFLADLNLNNRSEKVIFTFYWKKSKNRENRNYTVRIE